MHPSEKISSLRQHLREKSATLASRCIMYNFAQFSGQNKISPLEWKKSILSAQVGENSILRT